MSCTAWPVVWPCAAPADATDEQKVAATAAAQELLWSRTGRRLGSCTAVESYRVAGGGGCGRPWMDDRLVWHNGGRGGECCAIGLWSTPVQTVTTVTVGGVELDPTGYRLEGNRLMRVGACWPVVAACDDPVISVEYVWGEPIPDDGLAAMAMGEVAIELLHAMCGGPCKLPSRAVSVSRQGVTVELGSPAEWATSGLLGLPLADALILASNPGRLRQRSRVFSPDVARKATIGVPAP